MRSYEFSSLRDLYDKADGGAITLYLALGQTCMAPLITRQRVSPMTDNNGVFADHVGDDELPHVAERLSLRSALLQG